MDGKENILLKSFDNLLSVFFRDATNQLIYRSSLDSTLHPPTWDLVFKATWSYIPRPILNFVKYLPTREYKRFRSFVAVAKGLAHDLFKDRVDSGIVDKNGKDIMSVLSKSDCQE